MATKQHSNPRTWAFRGRKLLLPLLSLLALTALAAGLRALPAPFPRLEAAGFRITKEEYLQAMYQARNDVLSDHAAAGLSLTDWGAETALGDPLELTMERALDILRKHYAIGTLAVERGYLDDAGYEAMVQHLAEYNRNRQEALDSGAMVTGLPQFSMADYITYRASNLRLQFCSDPENPEFAVTQEEIRQRYEADRDNLYRQPDSMELAFLLADDGDNALQQAFEQALQAGDLAGAVAQYPELKPYYQKISVNPGTYSVYARSHGDILACADALQPGSLSPVLHEGDRLLLVQCLARTVHQYMPLEDVQSIVVQSIRESRYDTLIAARTEQTQIQGNLQRLYRFTAEQFR